MAAAQPQPVLVNGGAAVITAVLTPILLKVGIDGDSAAQIISLGLAVVAGCVSIWQLFVARKKVTPLTSPKDAQGRPLTP